jgi:hypothetical protein
LPVSCSVATQPQSHTCGNCKTCWLSLFEFDAGIRSLLVFPAKTESEDAQKCQHGHEPFKTSQTGTVSCGVHHDPRQSPAQGASFHLPLAAAVTHAGYPFPPATTHVCSVNARVCACVCVSGAWKLWKEREFNILHERAVTAVFVSFPKSRWRDPCGHDQPLGFLDLSWLWRCRRFVS